MKFYKTLDFTFQPDCLAGKQLNQLINLNCTDTGKHDHATVIIRQAYNPKIILGQDAIAREIEQKEERAENQKVDIALIYSPCDKTWSAHSKLYPTVYTEEELHHFIVKDI